ncbi:MFS transporter [Caldibacillus debilis]|uniref:MFS transporter n=1 Tax=Caldibacillus debilis TaxID=301148 RepID=UPI00037B5934|nr:MFS transporter [Caldibacillus debilis]
MEKRRILTGILLVVIGIFVTSNIYTLIPLYPEIGKAMGIPAKEAGYGSTAFTLFYACGLLLCGPLSDRAGRKKVMVAGLFLSAFTTFFVSLAQNPAQLYLFRGLQGFTLASFAPAAFSYSFELFRDRERPFWLALINAGFLCAGLLGQIAGFALADYGGWTSVYLFFSIAYGILAFLSVSLLPPSSFFGNKEGISRILREMALLLKNRTLAQCYALVSTLLFSFVAFYEALGYVLPASSEKFFQVRALGLAGAFLSLFTGIFIRRVSATRTLLAGIFLSGSAAVMLLFSETAFSVGLVSVFFVSGISLLIPTVIHLIGNKSGPMRGKALSLYSFLLMAGAALGSLAAAMFPYKIVLFFIVLLFAADFLIARNLR